jgi:hypothetical protein
MPGEAERFLSQFIALETQRGTPPEELMRKISDILAQRLRGSSVNVDARQMGNIPPGWRANYDDQGRVVSLEEIPGGPAHQERLEREERRRLQQEMARQQAEIMLRNIDKALNIINTSNWPVAGFGSDWMLRIEGSAAVNLQEALKTIKANIGFNQLNAMRQASPTGGALGNVTERELDFLQSVWGSLNQSQSPEELKDNLLYIREQILRVATRGMTENEIREEMERLRERQRERQRESSQPSAPSATTEQPAQTLPPLPRPGMRVINPPDGQRLSNPPSR